MIGFVYILKDELDRYYVGSTSDPSRRMYQHRLGSTKTTNRMKNPRLVLIQQFESLGIARKVELRLKNYKRRDFLDKIVKDGFIKLRP